MGASEPVLAPAGEPPHPPGRLPHVTSLDTPTRSRLALVACAWVGATLFGLAVAAGSTIGPIVVNLSQNHGVHLGDLVASGAAYLVALIVTITVLTPLNPASCRTSEP